MYFAVDSGARGCVELLLKRGAKVNAENSSGHSYLHVAVYGHNIAEAGNPDDQVAPPSSDPDNEAPVIADVSSLLRDQQMKLFKGVLHFNLLELNTFISLTET